MATETEVRQNPFAGRHRFFLSDYIDQPLLIHKAKAAVIADNMLAPALLGEKFKDQYFDEALAEQKQIHDHRLDLFVQSASSSQRPAKGQKQVSEDDIAVLSISGTLTRKYDFWASGGTSYDGLRAELDSLVSQGYKNILLYVDSPGGAAMGCFELTAYMRSLRETGISFYTFTDGYMASGGYALGAVSDLIIATPSAVLGSIAALMVHTEASRRNEAAGITYTILRSKSEKAIPDSLTPLNEKGEEKLLNMLYSYDSMFNTDIITSRPVLTLDDLVSMNGNDYFGNLTLDKQLADVIESDPGKVVSIIRDFKASKNNVNPASRGNVNVPPKTTSKQTSKGKIMSEETEATLAAQLALANTELSTLKASAKANEQLLVKTERERCSAIVTAGSTLKVKSDIISAHINKGYDAETSLDIMTAIAEATSLSAPLEPAGELAVSSKDEAKSSLRAAAVDLGFISNKAA